MNKSFCALTAALLALTAAAGPAGSLRLQENFDQLPAAAAGVPGFAIAEQEDNHRNVLKITRIDKLHQCFYLPLPVKSGVEMQFTIDYKGAGYFMLLNRNKQQITGGGINAQGRFNVISGAKDKWVNTGLPVNPAGWCTLGIKHNAAKGTFTVTVKGDDGEEFEAGPFPAAEKGDIAFLQLGNAYPVGNVSYADNIRWGSAAAAAADSGRIVLLQSNFDKTTGEIRAGGADFAIAADPEKPESGTALKIIRNTKTHNAVTLHFRKLLPPQRDFTVSLDYKGIGYVFVLDAAKKQVGAVIFTPMLKVISGDQNKFVSTQVQNDVRVRAHYDITFKMAEGTFTVKRTGADGVGTECGPFPLAGDGAPVQLQFGNSYPVGNVAWLDNLLVTCDTAIPLAGRSNILKPEELKLQGAKLLPGAEAEGPSIQLTAPEAVIEFHPASLAAFSLTRMEPAPGMSCELTAVNSAGHELKIAEVKAGNVPELYENEGRQILLMKAVLKLQGKPGSTLKKLGLWTPFQGSASSANRAFEAKVQGDFRLPVYEGNDPALLLLYNRTAGDIPVTVELTERRSGKQAGKTAAYTLKPGENRIQLPVAGLPDGEYYTVIRDASAGTGVKGQLRRLLRRQVLPEPVPPAKLELAGKKLFFPDTWQLQSARGLTFELGRPEVWPVTRKPVNEDAWWQHGGTFGIDEQGKLWLSFFTNDAQWTPASKRWYYAVSATPERPEHWEIRPENPGEKRPPVPESPLQLLTRYQTAKSLPGADGREHWRFHRPADGTPDLKQMEIFCVFKAPDPGKCVWEDHAPGIRTHWPVWHKGPGCSLLLVRKPVLVDSYPGDIEEGYESNDNSGGQWPADDGKTFFFSQGRVVRRFEPLNIPYDNLANISRLLTVFRTRDGVNFDRAYMVPPTMADPNGSQHYGAIHFRMKSGGPYLAVILKYYGDQQRYCNDLAYSWDGFNWKRIAAGGVFIDNTAPGTWLAGIANLSHSAFNYRGKLYWMQSWVTSAYHFYGEFPGGRRDLTGKEVQERFRGRSLEQWPLFKAFDGDYGKLAADINNQRMTPGVMILRQDGFFCAAAGSDKAGFRTRPIAAPKAALTVNAVIAPGGRAEFRICDLQGKVLAAKTLMPGDYLDAPLGLTAPDGDFIVEAEMQQTKLYTIGF